MIYVGGPGASFIGWFVFLGIPCYAIYDLIKKYTEQKRIEKKKKEREKEIAEFRKTYKSPLDDD
jgi:hypothetical protein